MTTEKARKGKPTRPAAERPIEWTRADPAALAKFDEATKTCTMNCGPHGLDPRSRKERLFLCDDCDCHAAPNEPKGTPATPMVEQNNPATVERARKKIAQLFDSTDWADLNYRYAVASGWLSALQLEGLVSSETFRGLYAELNHAREATSLLPPADE